MSNFESRMIALLEAWPASVVFILISLAVDNVAVAILGVIADLCHKIVAGFRKLNAR